MSAGVFGRYFWGEAQSELVMDLQEDNKHMHMVSSQFYCFKIMFYLTEHLTEGCLPSKHLIQCLDFVLEFVIDLQENN